MFHIHNFIDAKNHNMCGNIYIDQDFPAYLKARYRKV